MLIQCFWIGPTYEKKLMDKLPLTGKFLRKEEMEYHSKFGHNLGQIHHIAIMIRFDICYTVCCMGTQNMSPTLTGFQGLKC